MSDFKEKIKQLKNRAEKATNSISDVKEKVSTFVSEKSEIIDEEGKKAIEELKKLVEKSKEHDTFLKERNISIESFSVQEELEKIENLISEKTLNPIKKKKILNDIDECKDAIKNKINLKIKTVKDIKNKEEKARLKAIKEAKRKERIEFFKKQWKKLAIIFASIFTVLTGSTIANHVYVANHSIEEIAFPNVNEEIYLGDVVDTTYAVLPDNAIYEEESITISTDDEFFKENAAIKIGKTKIVALYEGEIISEKEVQVKPIIAESIFADNVVLGVNFEKEIEVTFQPENTTFKNYSVKSFDENIVEVKDNILLGVASGETQVEITSEDGPKTTVDVKVEYIEPDSISIINNVEKCIVGDTINFEAEFNTDEISNKNPVIEWSTSNKYIGSIDDNGVFTALNRGSINVTARYSEDVYDTKEINVIYPDPTSIEIYTGNNTHDVYVGNSLRLYVKFNPEKVENETITWSSDADSVATVNNKGIVTGVAVGTAKIKATSSNGKTSYYEITVKEKPVTRSNTNSSGSSSSSTPVVGDGITVYWTGTEYAKRFHVNSSCIKDPIAININDAKAKGLTACEKCAQGY